MNSNPQPQGYRHKSSIKGICWNISFLEHHPICQSPLILHWYLPYLPEFHIFGPNISCETEISYHFFNVFYISSYFFIWNAVDLNCKRLSWWEPRWPFVYFRHDWHSSCCILFHSNCQTFTACNKILEITQTLYFIGAEKPKTESSSNIEDKTGESSDAKETKQAANGDDSNKSDSKAEKTEAASSTNNEQGMRTHCVGCFTIKVEGLI